MTLAALVSLLIVLYLARRQFGSYGVLYPGAWFAIAWIVAILCYRAMELVGGVPVSDERLLGQLMGFVILTSISFAALSVLYGRRGSPPGIDSRPLIPFQVFGPLKMFAAIGLLGAFTNWLVLGAPFGYQDELRQNWLDEIPFVTAVTWHLYVLSFPAAIAAGWIAAVNLLLGKTQFKAQSVYLLMPLLAGLLWSAATGARQPLGIVILLFAVGACFGWTRARPAIPYVPLMRLVRVATHLIIAVIVLSVFVGLTGLERARQQGGSASAFDSLIYVAPIGQLISYMGLSVATHQAYGDPKKRDLSETGPVSIAGLQKFGLKYITGWRAVTPADTNPERMMASSGLPLSSATRNIFYDFQSDFGMVGARVMCIVMASLSHVLFLWRKRNTRSTLLGLTPLAIMLMFWGYSHQFSLLMFDTFYWLVVSSALWSGFCLMPRVTSKRI